MLSCPQCNAPLQSPDSKFCSDCGTAIQSVPSMLREVQASLPSILCPTCKATLEATDSFCMQCGTSLRQGNAVVLRRGSNPVPMRDEQEFNDAMGDIISEFETSITQQKPSPISANASTPTFVQTPTTGEFSPPSTIPVPFPLPHSTPQAIPYNPPSVKPVAINPVSTPHPAPIVAPKTNLNRRDNLSVVYAICIVFVMLIIGGLIGGGVFVANKVSDGVVGVLDTRGPNERKFDEDLKKILDPKERDMQDALLRPMVQATDKGLQEMTPAQRRLTEQAGRQMPSVDAGSALRGSGSSPYTSAFIAGFTVEPLNAENASKVGLNPGTGIYISAVDANSPAAAAGLVAGDIACAADGNLLTSTYTMEHAKAKHSAGEQILLRTWRNGRWYDIPVTLNLR